MTASLRVWLAFSAKLLVTLLLLTWLLTGVDWNEFTRILSQTPALPLICAVVLLTTTFIPVARRWQLLVQALGGKLVYPESLRVTTLTALINQCVPSNLGGDAYRVLMVTRQGMAWKRALLAAFVDRFVALFALAIVALLGIFVIINTAGAADFALLTIVGAGTLVLGVIAAWLILRSRFFRELAKRIEILKRLLDVLADLLNNPAKTGSLVALSLGVHCLTVAVMAIVAINTGLDVPLLAVLGVCAVGLLLARLPISIGGWGVREGAYVVAFSAFGVSREAALAASITYGLTELAMAIVGGLAWLFMTGNVRDGAKERKVGE